MGEDMTKTILGAVLVSLAFAAACGSKKNEEGAAKTTDQTAAKKGGADLSAIQTAVDAAKTKDDFEAVFNKCMGALVDIGLGGVKNPDKDPGYRATCKVAVARKRAAIVIAGSTPDKMNGMCLASAMELEELAGDGGAEAAEMKKLKTDVDTACGL